MCILMGMMKIRCTSCGESENFCRVEEGVSRFTMDMSGKNEPTEKKMAKLICQCGSSTWVGEKLYQRALREGHSFEE
ncbi:MAG: hypothetical protein ACLFQV_09940 [Vulcanimicrobiota bacterium]